MRQRTPVARSKLAFAFAMIPQTYRCIKRSPEFYETPTTTASTIFEITNDVLTRFELQLLNYRGQCYDGGSNMSGKVTALQKKICDVQPKALFIHCLNHSLNLSFQDAVSCIP